MGYEEDAKRFIRRKKDLKRHLIRMKAALPEAFDHAFDRYFNGGDLTLLKVEEKLIRFESLISKLDNELDQSNSMAILRQVAGRVNYIADQVDALESFIYKRASRRSRFGFNLSDFFKYASQERKNGSSASWKEITSITEAYEVLELEEGCHLSEVTASFRRFAKKYHPDARGGDRSNEKQLRRVVEAYRIIRESIIE